MSLGEAEKILIQRALAVTHGNVVHAAKLLRVSRDKLRYKIKKHQLQVSSDSTSSASWR